MNSLFPLLFSIFASWQWVGVSELPNQWEPFLKGPPEFAARRGALSTWYNVPPPVGLGSAVKAAADRIEQMPLLPQCCTFLPLHISFLCVLSHWVRVNAGIRASSIRAVSILPTPVTYTGWFEGLLFCWWQVPLHAASLVPAYLVVRAPSSALLYCVNPWPPGGKAALAQILLPV